MSLGWQCESAILPSKAKPIAVDSTSILGLKALIFSEEQKRLTSKKSTSNSHEGVHKVKRDDGTSKINATSKIARSRENIDPDDEDSKVLQSLSAKAKLYDDIAAGHIAGPSSLLNFECKTIQQKSQSPEVVSLDEFGRSIRDSQPYQWSTGYDVNSSDKYRQESMNERQFQRHVEEQIQMHLSATTAPTAPSSSSSGSIPSSSQSRGIYGEILPTHNSSSGVSEEAAPSVSAAARVRTQWEKTLNNSARGYLDRVHEDTEAERSQRILTQGNSGGTSSISRSDKGGTGVGTTGDVTSSGGSANSSNRKRTMREERLELLKAKQQKTSTAGDSSGAARP